MKKPKNLDTFDVYSDPATEDEFSELFPLTYAAIKAWKDGGGTNPSLRVTSKRAGYYRGDIQHSGDTVEHSMVNLKPHQVEAILDDPNLVAEIVDATVPPEPLN